MTRNQMNQLKPGSVIEDLTGNKLTVKKVVSDAGIRFVIATYGKGEDWLVPSHLEHYSLIKA